MTYNTRVLVGLAAILLMAVVFAQPALASNGNATETWASIAGMNDLTNTMLTNPSFEATYLNTATPNSLADGQFVQYSSNTNGLTGWTQLSGSSKSCIYNPTDSVMPGSAGSVLPMPVFPADLPNSMNCLVGSPGNPDGFTPASSGGNVLACYQADMMNQVVHAYGNSATAFTTAAHQTYVLTWEFGKPNATYNTGAGWTAGVFYGNTNAFCWINNDTSFDSAHSDGHYVEDNGKMYQFSWSFTTDSASKTYTGKNLSIRFGGGTTSWNAQYNFFDNVHLYANGVVPEPSTVALVITGALGMLAYAWRRKRRK